VSDDNGEIIKVDFGGQVRKKDALNGAFFICSRFIDFFNKIRYDIEYSICSLKNKGVMKMELLSEVLWVFIFAGVSFLIGIIIPFFSYRFKRKKPYVVCRSCGRKFLGAELRPAGEVFICIPCAIIEGAIKQFV
jgi:hypothetical protein